MPYVINLLFSAPAGGRRARSSTFRRTGQLRGEFGKPLTARLPLMRPIPSCTMRHS